MRIEDINDYNVLLDGKSYENILVYNILYENFMEGKLLRIRFDKADWAIKIYNGIRYLELSILYNEVYYRINSRIYYAVFDRINYLISEKSCITDSINHNLARIRIDSYSSLPRKKLTFHNVIMLLKSVAS